MAVIEVMVAVGDENEGIGGNVTCKFRGRSGVDEAAELADVGSASVGDFVGSEMVGQWDRGRLPERGYSGRGMMGLDRSKVVQEARQAHF